MAIREFLNQRKWIAFVASGAVVVVAIVWCYHQLPRNPSMPTQAYYSTNDGKTWFADKADRIPPFDKNGQPAVRAYVFKPASGGDAFTGYLEKYPDDVKQKLDAARKDHSTPTPADYMLADNIVVKRPGDPAWVGRDSSLGNQIINVRCKNGDQATPVQVGD